MGISAFGTAMKGVSAVWQDRRYAFLRGETKVGMPFLRTLVATLRSRVVSQQGSSALTAWVGTRNYERSAIYIGFCTAVVTDSLLDRNSAVQQSLTNPRNSWPEAVGTLTDIGLFCTEA